MVTSDWPGWILAGGGGKLVETQREVPAWRLLSHAAAPAASPTRSFAGVFVRNGSDRSSSRRVPRIKPSLLAADSSSGLVVPSARPRRLGSSPLHFHTSRVCDVDAGCSLEEAPLCSTDKADSEGARANTCTSLCAVRPSWVGKKKRLRLSSVCRLC